MDFKPRHHPPRSSRSRRFSARATLIVLALLAGGGARAAALNVAMLHAGPSPSYALREVSELVAANGPIDLWGIVAVNSESLALNFLKATRASGKSRLRYFLSRSGGQRRLQILYNPETLTLLETRELHYVSPSHRRPGALIGGFLHKASGVQFYAMVNDLGTTGASSDSRLRQARLVNRWAEAAGVPIIALGTYAFDAQGVPPDPAYGQMVAGDVFRWIRPIPRLEGPCAPGETSSFMFVGGPAVSWTAAVHPLLATGAATCTDASGDPRPQALFGRFDVR